MLGDVQGRRAEPHPLWSFLNDPAVIKAAVHADAAFDDGVALNAERCSQWRVIARKVGP